MVHIGVLLIIQHSRHINPILFFSREVLDALNQLLSNQKNNNNDLALEVVSS